jgi:hypothetical protein
LEIPTPPRRQAASTDSAHSSGFFPPALSPGPQAPPSDSSLLIFHSPQIPMSLRLATANEDARSALECDREAAAFSSFPSAHAPKTSKPKAVAAATAIQSAFGTAIFKADGGSRSASPERHAPRRRLSRGQAVPRSVQGPKDFFALRRCEAIRAGVRMGDRQGNMALSTFKPRPLYTTTTP